MSWHHLVGTPKQYAGVSGTVTLGSGEILLYVTAWATTASATLVIFGGPSITIPTTSGTTPVGIWEWVIEHTLMQASGAGAGAQLVFTNTAHYFIHSVKQGNTT